MSEHEKKILVVAYFHTIIRDTRNRLELAGYTNVQHADTAERALTMLRRERFDLVISDLQLDIGKDGRDLLLAIKSDENLSAIRFIMTANPTWAAARTDVMAEGADDFLVKPLVPAVLGEAIRGVFKKHGSEES